MQNSNGLCLHFSEDFAETEGATVVASWTLAPRGSMRLRGKKCGKRGLGWARDADTVQIVENNDVRKYFLRFHEVLIGIRIPLGKMT